MSSRLTEELANLGFLCGIDHVIYTCDTGKYTTLIIERTDKEKTPPYHYDFYKQTFYPHSPNKVTVYGKQLSAPLLLKRVRQYLGNRKQYLIEQQISNH